MLRSLTAGLLTLALVTSCARAQPSATSTRVMTYNIQWFAEEESADRLENLRAILADIKPHVVGLQEIQSAAALRQIFGDEWTLGLADDPKESQELAIAVRAPHKLVGWSMVFPGEALDYAFPGRRDVLRAVVQTPGGETLTVYVVHMKSRRGGRGVTDAQREMANTLLAGFLRFQKDENSVVLGDFNDGPDDRSLNILETGNPSAAGGQGANPKPLMVNLAEPLYRRDAVTLGLNRKYLGEDLSPVVPGAFASNEEWRGKEHRYPQDVKVIQSLFDQILVAPRLKDRVRGEAQIYSKSAALRGQSGRVQVDEATGAVNYVEKGSLASDHLPVFADLLVR